MNSQTIRLLATLGLQAVLLFGGPNAYARGRGVSTSGGGVGVLCKGATGQPKLQLLDFYEASLAQQELVQSTGSFSRDYGTGMQRLRRLFEDPRPVTPNELNDTVARFKKATQFTSHKLTPTSDMGATPTLPSHCHYEQIAVYHDLNNNLVINKELWSQLDSLNKAALLTHEVLYKMQRIAFFTDSHQVRNLVRELFLKNGPSIKGPRNGLKVGPAHLCFAGETSTNTDFTFAWQGKTIQLLTLAGDVRLAKTTLTVPVSIDDIKLEAVTTDLNQEAYKVSYTPREFDIKNQSFDSQLPIPHITWNQEVRTGELLKIGINIRGKTLSYPVKACFKYFK